tara:strand:- start:464 stop:649 length:186 start_codon:yes stop_codon:yes gene_type:complete
MQMTDSIGYQSSVGAGDQSVEIPLIEPSQKLAPMIKMQRQSVVASSQSKKRSWIRLERIRG